jgi:hypothetical protein
MQILPLRTAIDYDITRRFAAILTVLQRIVIIYVNNSRYKDKDKYKDATIMIMIYGKYKYAIIMMMMMMMMTITMIVMTGHFISFQKLIHDINILSIARRLIRLYYISL